MRSFTSISLIFFTFLGLCLSGQTDSHYWTHQYGAKGLLLNGAVIASADGETSIFYNPGSIGMDDNLGFAFSFLSPTYSNLRTTNFIGDNNVISDTGLGFSPGFLGVRFKPFKSDKIIAGITAFERFKTDITYRDRVVDQVNEGPLLLFRGDLDFNRKISEDWYGLGLFYRLSNRMGIGITQFSVWHNQRFDFNLKKEIVPTSTPSEIFLGWHREVGYDLSASGASVTKLGFCYRHEKFNFGLTYTSPMYGLASKNASYYSDDYRVNSPIGEFTNNSNRDKVTLENFKTAASYGLGFDVKIKQSRISTSVEYFTKVESHQVFKSIDDSFNGLSTDPEITIIDLTSEKQSVLNGAIGILFKASDKITLLGGLRTDFDQNSSLKINDSAEYLGTVGDVYHLSGGGMFQFGKNQFSLGIDLAYGSKSNGRQLADLTDLNQQNFFEISGKDNVSSRFYSMMVFLTYDFIFKTFYRQNTTDDN